MLELDWTERLTLGLTTAFAVSLTLTIRAGRPLLWLVWGSLWVLISGVTLVLVNRFGPPSDG